MNVLQKNSGVTDFYNRNFLWLELVIAALTAILFCVCVEFCWTRDEFAEFLKGSRQTVYASIVSLAGSLLGFVIATIPIILGFGQMNRLKIVRESGHYQQIFHIFFQAIQWLSAAIFGAIFAIMFDKDTHPRAFVTYGMVFLFLAVVVRVFRCVWVLKKITLIATKDAATTTVQS
jgi:hypothetical protein